MGNNPPDCPYCYGEREWSGVANVAACYFCGRSELLAAANQGKEEVDA